MGPIGGILAWLYSLHRVPGQLLGVPPFLDTNPAWRATSEGALICHPNSEALIRSTSSLPGRCGRKGWSTCRVPGPWSVAWILTQPHPVDSRRWLGGGQLKHLAGPA